MMPYRGEHLGRGQRGGTMARNGQSIFVYNYPELVLREQVTARATGD